MLLFAAKLTKSWQELLSSATGQLSLLRKRPDDQILKEHSSIAALVDLLRIPFPSLKGPSDAAARRTLKNTMESRLPRAVVRLRLPIRTSPPIDDPADLRRVDPSGVSRNMKKPHWRLCWIGQSFRSAAWSYSVIGVGAPILLLLLRIASASVNMPVRRSANMRPLSA